MLWIESHISFVPSTRKRYDVNRPLPFTENGHTENLLPMPKRLKKTSEVKTLIPDYESILASMVDLLESARRLSARSVNSVMTGTYWEIGRRIIELEQGGQKRAKYGIQLIERLASDLTERFGRGFSEANIQYMRRFYVEWTIPQTLSGESQATKLDPKNRLMSSKPQTLSGQLNQTGSIETVAALSPGFPLPWSHYIKLLAVRENDARSFYERESLRGGWTVRQLGRQIASQFYERALLSNNKESMLVKGAKPQKGDWVTPEEEIRDPLFLEFLDLKDEYSEHDLEDALIHKLEDFLLELGNDFTFVGRQRRLRIGDEWYRIDLLFFHRRLRCLVVIDLKLGKFTHADAGQMHMYLNYASEHWTNEDENPPVGLILCAQNDQAVAHYTLDNLPNKVMAREYKLALPNEHTLKAQLQKAQLSLSKSIPKTEPLITEN